MYTFFDKINHFFFTQDVSDLELSDLQKEMCPRISAADLGELLTKSPNDMAVIDLRSSIEYVYTQYCFHFLNCLFFFQI